MGTTGARRAAICCALALCCCFKHALSGLQEVCLRASCTTCGVHVQNNHVHAHNSYYTIRPHNTVPHSNLLSAPMRGPHQLPPAPGAAAPCPRCCSSAPPHYEPRLWNRSCNYSVSGVPAEVFFNRTGGTDDVLFPISPGYRIARQDKDRDLLAVVQLSCFGPGQRVNQTLVGAGKESPPSRLPLCSISSACTQILTEHCTVMYDMLCRAENAVWLCRAIKRIGGLLGRGCVCTVTSRQLLLLQPQCSTGCRVLHSGVQDSWDHQCEYTTSAEYKAVCM